jgi:hypothetical protein
MLLRGIQLRGKVRAGAAAVETRLWSSNRAASSEIEALQAWCDASVGYV